MNSFKVSTKMKGLCEVCIAGYQAALVWLWLVGQVQAYPCIAPTRPFVPDDQYDQEEFRDLIKRDFERYIEDAMTYFLCLDDERARIFEEAGYVSQDYGRFLEAEAN